MSAECLLSLPQRLGSVASDHNVGVALAAFPWLPRQEEDDHLERVREMPPTGQISDEDFSHVDTDSHDGTSIASRILRDAVPETLAQEHVDRAEILWRVTRDVDPIPVPWDSYRYEVPSGLRLSLIEPNGVIRSATFTERRNVRPGGILSSESEPLAACTLRQRPRAFWAMLQGLRRLLPSASNLSVAPSVRHLTRGEQDPRDARPPDTTSDLRRTKLPFLANRARPFGYSLDNLLGDWAPFHYFFKLSHPFRSWAAPLVPATREGIRIVSEVRSE